eukprot:TRINITY_DN8392_c0_g3_i2.p1 TRINITY_DN8392_c0_g3~~TRINITY_DN8392_c0_g3_i2.p1  ORF type:complete len:150 (+),score=37.96 TRINITY_DN8392_c0_g3_i2:198-647(+)
MYGEVRVWGFEEYLIPFHFLLGILNEEIVFLKKKKKKKKKKVLCVDTTASSRTEKNTGCNHMTCASCQYDWCWLCGGKCGPGHFDSYNLLGCAGLQFDETDEVSHHFGKRVKGKMTAAGTLALGVAAISVGAAIAPLALGGYAVSRVIR